MHIYDYSEARALAFEAQNIALKAGEEGTLTIPDVASAIHDSGYLMGLIRGGAPVEDQSFQLACNHLNGFIYQHAEV